MPCPNQSPPIIKYRSGFEIHLYIVSSTYLSKHQYNRQNIVYNLQKSRTIFANQLFSLNTLTARYPSGRTWPWRLSLTTIVIRRLSREINISVLLKPYCTVVVSNVSNLINGFKRRQRVKKNIFRSTRSSGSLRPMCISVDVRSLYISENVQ